jgi:hypothetical protein
MLVDAAQAPPAAVGLAMVFSAQGRLRYAGRWSTRRSAAPAGWPNGYSHGRRKAMTKRCTGSRHRLAAATALRIRILKPRAEHDQYLSG